MTTSGEHTVVHLLRHGEVFNPGRILYGRLPDYHLSDLGQEMARLAAAFLAERDVVAVTSSPLERALETAAPVAALHRVAVGTDARLLEATNRFEGVDVAGGKGIWRHPELARHLVNPFRPSWGEPYDDVARRMRGAIDDMRVAADGHEGVLVSHQLPIWVARRSLEERRLWHDPRRRECSLASVTSLRYAGDRLVSVSYAEPAAALLAGAAPGAGA